MGLRRLRDREPFAPRPVKNAAPPREISLTGTLFAWKGLAPAFFQMPLSEHLYLACFTTEEKLRSVHAQAGVPFDKIKHVDEQWGFLESLPRRLAGSEVRVILDPYFTPEGTVRFTEIKWN